MNRAERKRKQKEALKQNKVYYYKDKQVNEILAEKKEELKLSIIQELFGVMMISLRDEFGWFQGKYGKDRLDRYIERFNENMFHIDNNDTKLEDYNEWCEENDIRFEVKKMSEGA